MTSWKQSIMTFISVVLLYFVEDVSAVFLNQSDEFRLIKTLFGNYNFSSVRPVENNTKPVSVKFQMKLVRLVDVNSREMTLVTDVMIIQKWKNPFLTWDPKNYGGIKSIFAEPEDVWVPDTALINNAESNFAGSRTKYKTMVVLSYDGSNTWMAPATFKSSCNFDVSTFPFDTQLCQMTFGSWTFTENHMILERLAEHGHFIDSHFDSGDWKVPSIKLDKPQEHLIAEKKYTRLTYRLQLERKPVYFIIYLIVPSVLISLLVLFSFKIPVDSGERIGLCTTALLAMSVFLLLIGEHLPESSENIPLLAIASVLMMIMITLGFLATIIVLKCHHNDTKPPKLLRILCCVKKHDSSTTCVDTNGEDPDYSTIDKQAVEGYEQEWKNIARTMDKIFFYLFLSILLGTLTGVYLMAPLIVKLERNL